MWIETFSKIPFPLRAEQAIVEARVQYASFRTTQTAVRRRPGTHFTISLLVPHRLLTFLNRQEFWNCLECCSIAAVSRPAYSLALTLGVQQTRSQSCELH